MYQAHVRKSLVRKILKNDLPLSSFDKDGLKGFMKVTCPCFDVPSREMISEDCVQLFFAEKLKMKSFIKSKSQRVCLALDTWTPNNNVNYLCISAHFIDEDWKLHKKILSFTPIYSDEGEDIGRVVEKCLNDWEINDILTITAGKSSSNDIAITYIEDKLTNHVMDGKFFNSRCLVDVIKHMAKVVLDEYDESITRIHTAILYTRQSSARAINFKNCAKESGMDLKYTMRLDCPDKWIKIFGMLFTAEKYEEAFNLYETKDPRYRNYMEETCGLLVHDDWENARKVLHISAEFMGRYSDMFTSNATSDMYFDKICRLDLAFGKWEKSDDDRTHNLGIKIREEYYKYWGNIDELNMLTCIASVLDPTSKLGTIKYYFKFIYNQEDASDEDRFENVDESEDCLGMRMAKLVLHTLYDLIDEYKDNSGIQLDYENFFESLKRRKLDIEVNEENETELDDFGEDEENETELDDSKVDEENETELDDFEYNEEMETEWDNSEEDEEDETELDRYLNEEVLDKDDEGEFDTLLWWKNNSERFPVLSKIAKDVLAIPMSAVVSHSAMIAKFGPFTGDFRSSLPPSIVEALVCTENWRYEDWRNKWKKAK